MVSFRIPASVEGATRLMEELVGPRKYWIHNRVGGIGWEVSDPKYEVGSATVQVTVQQEELATLIILKSK